MDCLCSITLTHRCHRSGITITTTTTTTTTTIIIIIIIIINVDLFKTSNGNLETKCLQTKILRTNCV
jgi:hypothetical protein